MGVAEMQECGCVIGKHYPASAVGALENVDCVLDSAKELEHGQPWEQSVDTASGKIYTFDENLGSFQGGYGLKDLRTDWHLYMAIVGGQGEKRIDAEDSRALTFEEVFEAYKGQFDVAGCHRHWSKYMALSECVLFTLKGQLATGTVPRRQMGEMVALRSAHWGGCVAPKPLPDAVHALNQPNKNLRSMIAQDSCTVT